MFSSPQRPKEGTVSNRFFVVIIVTIAGIFGCQVGHAKTLEEMIEGAIVVNPRSELVTLTTQFHLPVRTGAWSLFGMNSEPGTISGTINGGECLMSPHIKVITFSAAGSKMLEISGRTFEITITPGSEVQVGFYGTWTAACTEVFDTKITGIKSNTKVIDFGEPGGVIRLSN